MCERQRANHRIIPRADCALELVNCEWSPLSQYTVTYELLGIMNDVR